MSGATLVGGAVGLVLGTAVLFAVVGMLRDDSVTVDDVASDGVVDEAPTADGSEAPSETPAPTAEPAVTATATPTPTTSPEPEPEPSPSPTAEPPAAEVDPGSVTIQVLDALGGTDTSVADAVAAELRELGYDVVVVNRAGRSYDRTTVFWSPGQEDAGRQVAAAIGAADAQQTPPEVQLSDAVAVHVVVGADRA